MFNRKIYELGTLSGLLASTWLAGCAAEAGDIEPGSEEAEVGVSAEALSGQGFTLKNTNTGKCLSAANPVGSDAALVPCTGVDNQRWYFDGGFLKNTASGLCLDIENASLANGIAAQVYSCQGTQNQDIRLYPTLTHSGVSVTNWYMVVRHSSKCLETGPGSTVVQSNNCLSAWNVVF